ncbi:MAG: hypothetical protein AB1798_18750, partial [Spirochaetota bacterium]
MIKLGKMTRFYRNQPILSEALSSGGLQRGGELMEVPPYLLSDKINFPYKKGSGLKKEMLFADHFTAVRFFGGIKDANILHDEEKNHKLDLAYRDRNGKIQYRWELLERLRPFVDIYGKEFTLVLDNIPWDLAKEPSIDGYGQVNPPRDYDEWKDFIEEFVQTLIAKFGFETVNAWRFRLATEGRINLNTEEFCRHYDITTGIIKKALPGAKFTPFNMCKVHETETFHINYYEVVKHCSSGKNYFTGKKGSPLDFLSVSFYSFPAFNEKGKINPWTVSPLERVCKDYHDFWEKVGDIDPAYSKIPREIQELGILNNEYGFYTKEQGPRMAAWLFQLLFNMKQYNNLTKSWHWHLTDVVDVPCKKSEEYNRLLQANGWLYSILEYTEGSEIYVLDTVVPQNTDENMLFKSVGFIKAKKGDSYIIVSAFNNDRDKFFEGDITIELSSKVLKIKNGQKLSSTILSKDNDVYTAIRADL